MEFDIVEMRKLSEKYQKPHKLLIAIIKNSKNVKIFKNRRYLANYMKTSAENVFKPVSISRFSILASKK